MAKSKKQRVYDINFKPAATAMFCVIATSVNDAKKVAEKQLAEMTKTELADRLLAAVDFMGLKITGINYVEDWEEDE